MQIPFAQLLREPLREPAGLYPRTTLHLLLLLILFIDVLPVAQSHGLLAGAILLVGPPIGTLTHFTGVPVGRAHARVNVIRLVLLTIGIIPHTVVVSLPQPLQ